MYMNITLTNPGFLEFRRCDVGLGVQMLRGADTNQLCLKIGYCSMNILTPYMVSHMVLHIYMVSHICDCCDCEHKPWREMTGRHPTSARCTHTSHYRLLVKLNYICLYLWNTFCLADFHAPLPSLTETYLLTSLPALFPLFSPSKFLWYAKGGAA